MPSPINLTKNALLAGLSNLSSVLLLLLLIFAARHLTIADFGKLTFALALTGAIALISDFGITEFTKRSVARDPTITDRYFSNGFVWKALLAALSWILMIAVAHVLTEDPTTRYVVAILGVGAITRAFKALPIALFQAKERFDLSTISQLTHHFLVFTFVTIALALGSGLLGFSIVFVAVKLVDVVLTYVLMVRTRIAKFRLAFDKKFMMQLQRQAIPFGLFVVVVQVYAYADTIMLAAIRGDTEVGLYNAAYKIYEGMTLIALVLHQAISPQLARLYSADLAAHGYTAQRALKFAAMVAAFCSFSGFIFSGFVIRVAFGQLYIPSTASLQILSISFMFVTLNYVLNAIMVSIDRQMALLIFVSITLLLNIILNLVLIPQFGHVGAAAATAMSTLVMTVMSYTFLSVTYHRIPIIFTTFRVCLAGGASALTVVALDLSDNVLGLCIAALLYAALLVVFRAFDSEDILIARKITRLGRSVSKRPPPSV